MEVETRAPTPPSPPFPLFRLPPPFLFSSLLAIPRLYSIVSLIPNPSFSVPSSACTFLPFPFLVSVYASPSPLVFTLVFPLFLLLPLLIHKASKLYSAEHINRYFRSSLTPLVPGGSSHTEYPIYSYNDTYFHILIDMWVAYILQEKHVIQINRYDVYFHSRTTSRTWKLNHWY